MVSQVNLKCDFGKGVSEDIYARYGESGRVVSFDFVNSNIDGGVVEVSNARFCLVKSDGNFVIQDFDNSVGLDLTSNMCASSGIGSYEVQVSVDGVVVSGRGSFIVSDRIWNDEVVESVSEGNGLIFPDDFQEKLIAGEGIKIEGNVISWDGTVDWARWYKEMKEWREASVVDGVVEFETVEEGLLKELVVGVESVQDLHGYDKPWIGGAGKNLLPMTVEGIKSANTSGAWNGNSYTLNGVTFEILTDSDGNVTGIRANGTASNGNSNFFLPKTIDLSTLCVLNGVENGSSNTYYMRTNISGTYYTCFNGDVNLPISNSINDIWIGVYNNATVSNVIFYPMIRLAAETDATFAPYTNICPISGWDSVKVSLKDGDRVTQREYSIALGQTVYGGVLDVVKGELRIEKVSVDLGSLEWARQYVNSRYRYGSASISNNIKIESSYTNGLLSSCFYANDSPVTNISLNGTIAKYNNGWIYVICDEYSNVNDFVANMTGQTLIYDIDTPITVQITPQEILALEGVNEISADSGDVISCVYSKIVKYISARSVFMDNGKTVQKAVSDLQ